MVWIAKVPKWDRPVTIEPVERDADGRIPPRPRTLLIIEDDPTMRLAMACMVAEEGWQVVVADSAEDALGRLDVLEPDVILCDYVLEGMTGREFCQRLKASPCWRFVPVIMVTRLDEPSITGDLLRSGADDVMIKPVRGEELRARVHCALRRRDDYRQLGASSAPLPSRSLNSVGRFLDVRA
ncbi:MAG: response regulator [Pseudomonadota bacterium]|jgi:DNA-binding response OmpR family regulator|nr:MAG: hypothetical protein DIU62_00325 [Pseudomonadota bacterium]